MHPLSAFAVLVLLAVPNADRADCGAVSDRYTAAVADVATALRSYAKCIALSNGHDQCAAEMQTLDTAHDNFVDAVGDMKDCK